MSPAKEWAAGVPAVRRAQIPGRMREAQRAFDRPGGLHAATLFTLGGDPIVIREDVGRHNAVDKATGHAVRTGMVPFAVPS